LDGDQTLQLVAPDLNADARKQVLEAQGKIYEAKYLASVKAFAGVRDVFELLTMGGGKPSARTRWSRRRVAIMSGRSISRESGSSTSPFRAYFPRCRSPTTLRKIVASDKKCCFTLLETVDLDFAMVSAGIVVTAPGRIAGLVG
jgi:hypothetical protein